MSDCYAFTLSDITVALAGKLLRNQRTDYNRYFRALYQ